MLNQAAFIGRVKEINKTDTSYIIKILAPLTEKKSTIITFTKNGINNLIDECIEIGTLIGVKCHIETNDKEEIKFIADQLTLYRQKN